MRAEIVYRSKKKEVVYSIRVYPRLYLCIIANPAKEVDGEKDTFILKNILVE